MVGIGIHAMLDTFLNLKDNRNLHKSRGQVILSQKLELAFWLTILEVLQLI